MSADVDLSTLPPAVTPADFRRFCHTGDLDVLAELDEPALAALLTLVEGVDAATKARLAAPDALAKAAAWYAGRGWPVFPLMPWQKAPLGQFVPRGVLDASTDAGLVAWWWTQVPSANIGIAAGVGFDVVDVDPPDGYTSFGRLRETWPVVRNPIATVATPRHGRHYWVPVQPGMVNGVAMLPGLDYRTTGGYVVAPPSRQLPAAMWQFVIPPA